MIEIYAIELKNISKVKDVKEDALNPDKLKRKWENCLNWALNVVKKFKSVKQGGFGISSYVVLVIPEYVRRRIATLIKNKGYMYKPNPSVGRLQGLILSCNTPITGHADVF